MKNLNLETAGEFLVMASTLMQIKAQMLLPSPETEQEEGPDPRAELSISCSSISVTRSRGASHHL